MQSAFSLKRLDALNGLYIRALEIGDSFPRLKILAYSEVWSNCIFFYNIVKENLYGEEQANGKKLILQYKQKLPLKIDEIIKEPRISKMRKSVMILSKISFRFSAWMMSLILKHKYG